MTIQELIARSTNAGIIVENTTFPKTYQNDSNSTPKVPLTWDAALWNTITGLTHPTPTTFVFGEPGIYLFLAKVEVFSPSSAKLQVKINSELNAVPLGQSSYTGLTIATDFNSSIHLALIPILIPGSVGEMFGERAGQAGTVDMTAGEMDIIRLTNFSPI